jgi:transposase
MVVANAAQTAWLFRNGRRNERLDAQMLAALLHLGQLPNVHLPPADVSLWRDLIQYRRRLVNEQSRIKNRINALLRSEALRCPHRSCWTRSRRSWLESLVFARARQVVACDLLRRLDDTRQSPRTVERELDTIADRQPPVRLLRTIPGIGPRTADAIVAFTDDPRRFRARKHYASSFGVTPTEHSSGLVQRRGRISRRDPSVVRWVLAEAVHLAVRWNGVIRAHCERVCCDTARDTFHARRVRMEGWSALQPVRRGSSGIPGECGSDLEEEVLVVTEAVGHALDDLDLVVDPFQQAGVQRAGHMGTSRPPAAVWESICG